MSNTPVDHIDAEIVPTLDRPAAERLDRRIRLLVCATNDNIAKLHELVQEPKNGAVHIALGYPSWTAYLADVFTIDLRLGSEARTERVGYLSGEGMSQRAIADVIGIDRNTVRSDLRSQVDEIHPPEIAPVLGLDGKTYQPKPVSAKLRQRREWAKAECPGLEDATRPRRKPIADARCCLGIHPAPPTLFSYATRP